MTATLKSIRAKTDIRETPENKGLQMITVKAYDNGLVEANGRTIKQSVPPGGYDQRHGWLGAVEHITLKLSELRRQARRTAGEDQRSPGRAISPRLPAAVVARRPASGQTVRVTPVSTAAWCA